MSSAVEFPGDGHVDGALELATGTSVPAPGTDGSAAAAGLGRDALVGLHRHMLLTRAVEDRGVLLYRQGKIPGGYYTGRGNEACSVAVAAAMGPDDVGAPLHRDLGVHLTRGVEPWRVFAQYMGRVDGPTRGRDNSVHMADATLGLFAMVSHLPAMLPVAVGAALAFHITQQPRVAIAWYGDGASARGDTHEGMNLAGVHRLPVVFICENNQYAYSTPTHLNYASENLAQRAAGYGFEGVVVDGTDILAVYAAARRAIEQARAGGGPALVEAVSMRMSGHAIQDEAAYVPRELLEYWEERDPIERFRQWLRDNVGFSDDEERALLNDVAQEVAAAVERAAESPTPAPETLCDGVYASDPAG